MIQILAHSLGETFSECYGGHHKKRSYAHHIQAYHWMIEPCTPAVGQGVACDSDACDKGEDNGEYDPIELIWYEGDDVVCDEDGEPLEDSDKYLGFDIAEKFQDEELAEASGDKDVRIVFNHQHHSIFFITRRQGSYSQHKRLEELGSDAYDDEDDEDDRIREWVHSRS